MESAKSRCKSRENFSVQVVDLSFEGKDDITGEPLTQREDDKPEVIRSRLNTYDNNTNPIMDFYK